MRFTATSQCRSVATETRADDLARARTAVEDEIKLELPAATGA
jgi:hypothetical protein